MVNANASIANLTLVTGATGGLGKALCAALRARGHAVRATGRNKEIGTQLEALGCEFVPADISEPLAFRLTNNVTTIFHLAAISKPWGCKEEFELINLNATEQLLETARNNGCRTLVYASTPSIFAEARNRLNIGENDPIAQPLANDYARTKYLAEQSVLAANGIDLNTVVLRPRAIVGPDDNVLLPRLLRAARRGFMPLPRRGKTLIEITDVRDVVDAFLAAEEHITLASGRAFNISGGKPLMLKSLLEMVFAEQKLKVRYIHLPASVLLKIGTVLEWICTRLPEKPEPLLTRYMAKTLSYSQTLDISLARRVLGWEPKHSTQEAISYAFSGAKLSGVDA